MNPWDFPLWCHVFAWLVADRSTTVKPSKFLKKRIDITRTNTSFFYSNQLREHLRLDQFRIRSPSWQPVMAKSIPVGKTPGQQERRQRSAAGTLIMQCTAEHPESEGLHHVSDSLITLSGYLKDYWWGNWFLAAFSKIAQTLWLHERLCLKKQAWHSGVSFYPLPLLCELLEKQECFPGVPLVQFLLVGHWWMWKVQKTTGGI